jgi:UDP-glucose 4-epimerase
MQSAPKSQPWVVTGAAGFLGSHIVEQLLLRRDRVIGIDNLTCGKWKFLEPFAEDPHFKFIHQDIRDEAAITEIFREEHPDQVIHLAGLHFIPAAMRDPAHTVSLNVLGTQTLLSACRQSEVRCFWFASTADVYQASETPHHESSTISPFNIYGLTKWMGEQLIELEARMHPKRRFVIGRLFNMYGPHETNPHILPEIIDQLRRNGSGVLRLGNVTPKRDLVPVADAARAAIETVEQSSSGLSIVNVGTGVSVSVQELVELISTIISKPLKIVTDSTKVRPVERPHLQANVAKLKEMIGWAPNGDLSRGLRELLRYEGIIA